jgi:hypothetical protein
MAAGASMNVLGGVVSFNQVAGSTATVGAGIQTISVSAGATLNITATNRDPLSDQTVTTNRVNLINNGQFNLLAGASKAGAIDGTGNASLAASTSLQALHVRQNALNLAAAASLTVQQNGAATGTSVVKALNLAGGSAPTAKLDLKDNDLVIDYGLGGSPINVVRAQIKSGYASGAFNGNGITTTLGDATHALGYLDNFTVGLGSFSGQSVDATSVLVKYTYRGDADLDGDADGVDIGKWATNFTGELGGGAGATMSWSQGDWDYDGDVDGVDAGLWATAFTGELGGNGLSSVVVNDPSLSGQAAQILKGLGVTVVPEPAATLLAVSGAAWSLQRPRSRRFARSR